MNTRRGTSVVLSALVLALAACSSGSDKAAPSTSTAPPRSPTSVATPPSTRPKAELEFREVVSQYPNSPSGPSGQNVCELAGNVAQLPEHALLFDRDRKSCFVVGPTLLNGKDVTAASVAYDATMSQFAVLVHFGNDDFLTRVGRPLIGKTLAIVLDDVVQSAPTINPGIEGRDVEITADFNRAQAVAAAAAIAGIDPSRVSVEDAADNP